MKRFVLCLSLAVLGLSVLAASDIGFIESFSLARDRAASLKQLIPGTEDYYYFHALHYLQQEQYEKVREQFKPWVERHGETGRYYEILTRLHLHEYDRNPQKTLQYIKDRLGLSFDH
ncbi:MAG TPA: hypothetical protein PLX97_06160, partial [Gemmatales bacterium]|nr:hypothetical protein [Gemmatales bacterium]